METGRLARSGCLHWGSDLRLGRRRVPCNPTGVMGCSTRSLPTAEQAKCGHPQGLAYRDDGGVAKAGAGQRASEYNGSTAKAPENRENQPPDSVDLLGGMPEADKWGIKGLRTLMNNYPDYHAMIVGLDPQALGLDVASPE